MNGTANAPHAKTGVLQYVTAAQALPQNTSVNGPSDFDLWRLIYSCLRNTKQLSRVSKQTHVLLHTIDKSSISK